MQPWIIYSIGFIAQILFSGRLLVQWALSEKAKRVITPSLFWQMSLLASFLLFAYGYLRNDFAIMLGQSLTYFIYIRNLQLQGNWQKMPKPVRIFILIFPILLIIYAFNNNKIDINNLFKNDAIPIWILIWGSIAQVIFTLRFVYQWIYSEKNKESILPFGFWLLSLIGSIMILTYAVIRKDPVLFTGHIFGSIVYIRNLTLIHKHHD
ncbi:MAG: lauroyl acyltransferase [Flavobacteriaceae bacterium]|nr:MAG: lauroyl acyltransferase [Flavobacteriaceae bacterium]